MSGNSLELDSRKSRNSQIFFWLPILSVILILFGSTFLRGRALFWGLPITQFVPWWLQTKFILLEGVLPLWNPNLGMGAPLLANYQLGFFYPANWLFLAAGWLAGAEGIAWIQAIYISIHLVWAALGMRLLAKALGLPVFGQVVAAVAFAFSGYLVARAWFLPITSAVSWLPWAMWAGYSLTVEIRRVRAAGMSWARDIDFRRVLTLILILTMQLLSGHAQVTWYSTLFLGLWMLFWAVQPVTENDLESNSSVFRLKQVGSDSLIALIFFGISVLAAAALAAIQLIPTAEYLLQSQRASAVDYEIAMTYSFWPWRFLGFFAPNLFGNPAFGNYWGYANFWEDAVYIGLIPISLALSLLVKSIRNAGFERRLSLFLVASAFIAFILALGQNLPIFPWLYQHVPTFDMFNGPTRWSILAVFSLSLLAGMGASRWSRPEGRALYWTRLGTAAGFAITLGAAAGWLALQQNNETIRLQTMSFAVALAGIWALGGGLLTLRAPAATGNSRNNVNTRISRWHVAAIAWIVIDLTVAGFGLNPSEHLRLYADNSQLFTPVSDGRVYMPGEVEREIKFEDYFLFSTFHAVNNWDTLRSTYLPNISILNGRSASVNNFDPMVPNRYADWMAVLDKAEEDQLAALLNLSQVSTVVNKNLDEAGAVVLETITPGAYIRTFRCQQFFSSPDRLLAAMLENPEILDSVIFLEASGLDSSGNCEAAPTQAATLLKATSTKKDIKVSAQQPVWLMIAESWYPGWQVYIDGQRQELLRADYMFQAVRVPAGEHEVRFKYSPWSFTLGLIVTILMAAVVGAFVIGRGVLKKQ